MDDLFVREEVPAIPTEGVSLLTHSLSRDGGAPAPLPSPTPAPVEKPAVAPSLEPAEVPFGVGEVISMVVSSCAAGPSADCLPTTDAKDYQLLIAEDNGDVDPDFPELDHAVSITSVGIHQFVLCEAGTGKECIRMSIPPGVARWRASSGEPKPDLPITCSPVSAHSMPFSVSM